ncbi:hypothetical protein [Hymenobacter lapidarius]|uniref:hypothetical protein n=1 Tax=Hymenobacter lapidarius TaxID=1908237 RepID=UPI000F79A831|nr:hypothetical protein [Hymenobacter lapidarius]
MKASRSPDSRRDRGQHAGPGSAWAVSAATRQGAQEADAAMAWEDSSPDYPKPTTAVPLVSTHLYFLP